MKTWRNRLALFALLLLPLAAMAQEPALDLKAALALADSQNLELRAARQQRAVALAGITSARQIPNPLITFGASRDAPHENVLWDQPFEIGGQRGKRIAVAREEQKSAEVDISALARQIRRRTREAFFRSLAARAQTAQAKAALDLATSIKQIVQQRYEAGDVAQLEVIQADVELARSNAEYEVTAQAERSADVELVALLGRKPDSPLDLSGVLADVAQPPSLDQITATALQSNAGVERTAQDLQTEQRRLKLAKAERIPNVDLQAGADLNSPPDFQAGPRGQIGVTVPLFYHGQGEVALSSARLEVLRLTLQAQQLNASAAVAAAYYDYVAKSHQAQQYKERIVPETVQLEQMATDSYQSGKSSLLTLIDAQRNLNAVQKAYLDSLLAAQTSFAAMEEVVGAPLD